MTDSPAIFDTWCLYKTDIGCVPLMARNACNARELVPHNDRGRCGRDQNVINDVINRDRVETTTPMVRTWVGVIVCRLSSAFVVLFDKPSALQFLTMEKVSLYDPEKDIVVDIMLSAEDFLRAQTDTVFATSLLNAAIKEKNITTNEDSIESIPIQQTTSTVHKSAYTGTNAKIMSTESDTDDGGSIYRWSTATVLLLLDTYKRFEEKFSNGKYSQKKIWEEISAIMAENGHMITGPQCAAKLRSLKKTYKSVKDHNNLSGNDRRTWQFYEIMDEIFSKRAWCSPVAVASSTGLSTKQDKDVGLYM